MTEENSTTSQLSVAMTTTGVTPITGGNTLMSSPSRTIFQCAVLIIGVVGIATNAIILYALVASKQHKKHGLIVHQNAIDLFSSFFIFITYSLKLCNIYLTGYVGYWLCKLILSDSLTWCGAICSVINLAIITVERYLKVVHPIWSKNKLRNWMMYSAMAFAWIVSFISNVVVVFPAKAVIDGACYGFAMWKNKTDVLIYFVWNFVLFYVVELFIFIFCYWRILIVLRRQARVMAGHSAAAGPSTTKVLSMQMQANVIKTMVFISAFYAVSWLPCYVYFLHLNLSPNPTLNDGGFYACVSVAFMYLGTNPFIYAIKFEPVKQVLLRLILCRKTGE